MAHRLGDLAGASRKREHGAALVELVMALPVLIAVVVGTADFGRVMYTSHAVTHAARAGAEWGAQSTANADNTTGITNAAQNAVGEGAQADMTLTVATPVKTCQCVPDAPTTPSDLDTTNDCSVTTCSSGQHLVISISVTVSKTFTTISPYPGIPQSLPISRTMRMRVQ